VKKCLLTLSILLANSVYSTGVKIEPEDTYSQHIKFLENDQQRKTKDPRVKMQNEK